jgi:hypothetical protein
MQMSMKQMYYKCDVPVEVLPSDLDEGDEWPTWRRPQPAGWLPQVPILYLQYSQQFMLFCKCYYITSRCQKTCDQIT